MIGRDFDMPLLAAVAGRDEDRVIDLCDAAVDRGGPARPTDDPDRYTFAHALIEHTLYDGLSPARDGPSPPSGRRGARADRRRRPRRPRAGELAYHWAQAVQPTDDRQGRPLRPGSPATGPSTSSRPTTPCAGTARRSTFSAPRRRTACEPSSWSAWVSHNARSATRPTERPWPPPPTWPTRSAIPTSWSAPRSASCRNFMSDTGTVAEELVALLRLAVDRLEDLDTPDRAPVARRPGCRALLR